MTARATGAEMEKDVPRTAAERITMPDEIEVGADGDDLRYWQAKEALRHAELRLGSQSVTLQAFEARATSILG